MSTAASHDRAARVAEALRCRFDAVCESELRRLHPKLRRLTPEDQRCVERIAADVVHAIAGVPAGQLGGVLRPFELEALVRLFALE